MLIMETEHMKMLDEEYLIMIDTVEIIKEHMEAQSKIGSQMHAEIANAQKKAERAYRDLRETTKQRLKAPSKIGQNVEWVAKVWKENDERNKKEG